MNKIVKIIGLLISLGIVFIITLISFSQNMEKDIPNLFPQQKATINSEVYEYAINPYSHVISSQENAYNKETHSLSPGIHIIQSNQLGNHTRIIGKNFSLRHLSPGNIYINNLDPKKIRIFSIDTIAEIELQYQDEYMTSLTLYPHSYFIFDTEKTKKFKNADILKLSNNFILGFYAESIFGENKSQISEKSLKLFIEGNSNQNEKEKLEKIFIHFYNDVQNKIQILAKNTQKSFITIPGIQFIERYKNLLINKQKSLFYYKNTILKNLIELYHTRNIDKEKIQTIVDKINQLEGISKEDAEEMKEIIKQYLIYTMALRDGNSSSIENLQSLLYKINNVDEEIHSQTQNLIYLKSIFGKYDFDNINNILTQISGFSNTYISDIKNLSKTDIEYFIYFLENILKSTTDNEKDSLEALTTITANFVKALAQISNITDNQTQKQTRIFKNLGILEKISTIIAQQAFEEKRNSSGLLIKKANKDFQTKMIQSLKQYSFYLLDMFDNNRSIFDESISINEEIIKRYTTLQIILNEQFSALIDYEQYKSNYDLSIQELLGEESINKQAYSLETLSKTKALDFLQQFQTGHNPLQVNNIDIQNYEECLEIGGVGDTQTPYCYYIQNMKVGVNNISFRLFPYEGNKINNITINNKKQKGSYILDSIEKQLQEKLRSSSNPEERYKYEFKNFMLQTFSNQKEEKTSDLYIVQNNSIQESKAVKGFKRTKLLGNNGDFAPLKNILFIRYDDIKVDSNYNITIEKVPYSIDICDKSGNCSISETYIGLFESQYIFTEKHSFSDIKMYPQIRKNNGGAEGLIGGYAIEVDGEVPIGESELLISKVALISKKLHLIYQAIKHIGDVDIEALEYKISKNEARVKGFYKGKKMIIQLKDTHEVFIYMNGKKQNTQSIDISEIQNFFFTY